MSSALAGRRVLVTGHTGFKGSWLVSMLDALGAEVSGVSLEPDQTPNLFSQADLAQRCHRHTIGDIRDLDLVLAEVEAVQPELVLHLAAQPLVIQGYRSPVETFAVNAMGTVNVLEAIRLTPSVRAAVMVTTDKAYEPRADRPHREGDRLGGLDPYSASKAAAELAIASYTHSYYDTDGPIVASVRAGNVIGGGDWAADRILVDAAAALTRGEPIAVRSPAAIRPWQHVLDALSGYLTVAERALSGERAVARPWNFGPEAADHVRVDQMLELFAQAWGAPLEVDLTEATYQENPVLALDSTDARSLLGWRTRWNVEEAVALTAQWYRDWAAGQDAGALLDAQVAHHLGGVPA